MNITITETAKKHFMESDSKNYRIILKGYGWAGPVFGLVQGEPQDNEEIYTVDNINFSIEKGMADLLPGIEIDYHNGLLQKGYVVYVTGSSRSC